jgi:hypothetical protein
LSSVVMTWFVLPKPWKFLTHSGTSNGT